MARLQDLELENLTVEQRAVYDAIQSGPRGARHGRIGLVGPFGVWIRSPAVGMVVQEFGAAVRFTTTVDEAVKEVAICTVGAHFRSKFEFAAHQRLALEAGVPESFVDAIAAGTQPESQNRALMLSHALAQQLLDRKRVDDATYAEAASLLGEDQLIQLVTVIGYYCMVSVTLNLFEVPVSGQMQDPFPDEA